MAFNADEHAAALLPPVLIAGGTEYRGRILSVEEVVRLYASRGDEKNARAAHRFLRRCIDAWFPAPWWARLVGYNPVWRAFRRLPDATQVEAFESFSLAQRLAAPRATRPSLSERTEATTT